MDNVEVLKFYATWCRPCRIYAKTFDKVVDTLSVPARSIDIERSPEEKEKFGITNIPTTIVLVDGVEKRRHVGAMLNRDLTHMIEQERAAHDY